MNYSQAIQFLYQLRLFGLKFGLENTLRLAELAGRPQDKLRFIHVAGTNGKGSTCAMLESVYRAAGHRVGLFTSPHLVSFAERIQVNRQCIARQDVSRLTEWMKRQPVFAGQGEVCPTFFEVVTVMALIYFAEQKCDLVIWETGMGGRLDATNIVTPLASVITNVQLDHQQWLGHTVAEIAREKAGIIKPRVPVITGADDLDALRVIVETARDRQAPLSVVTAADAAAMANYELSLAGEHQRMNAAAAAKVVAILDRTIPVSPVALRQGLKETPWAGRRQIIRRGRSQVVMLDGAHNPAAARTLAGAFDGASFALILGMMRDKDGAEVCGILAPLASRIFLAPMGSDRGADPNVLAEHCQRGNPAAPIVVCASLAEALQKAAEEPRLLLTGSLHLVGEALERLGAVEPSSERALNDYGGAPPRDAAIRAVTFDVGGTLIEPWPSVGEIYARVAKRHGLRLAPERLNQQFAAAWRQKKDFRHRKSDWAGLVNQTFAGLAETPLDAKLFAGIYDEFANAAAWRVFDDVRPCLGRLKESGVKLGAVSNWDERLRPLLKALELERYFDVVIISCETGHCKPAPEIFRAAANQLLTPPPAILHIGDSRAEDYEGARAAGLQSLLLARRGKRGPEQIDSLDAVDLQERRVRVQTQRLK